MKRSRSPVRRSHSPGVMRPPRVDFPAAAVGIASQKPLRVGEGGARHDGGTASDHDANGVCQRGVHRVSCGKCSNWVELSGNDPRRRVDGYGFHFNAESDVQDFTCVACGCKAEDRYFVTGECDECAEPDEREVTDEILAALGRCSV